MPLPVIKGVAYTIIGNSGNVFYSSPQCERLVHLHEGDRVRLTVNSDFHSGVLEILKSSSEEKKPISITTVFDLIWHGEQAKMLLVDTKKTQTEMQINDTFMLQVAGLASNSLQTTFKCSYDETLSVISIDEKCLDLTGYPSQILTDLSTNYRNLISTVDLESIYKLIQKFVDNKEPYSVLYPIKLADGESKWVEEHGKAVINNAGDVLYLEGQLVDAVDRKKIEDALWESESRYHSLFEASPDVVLLLDKNGSILLANNQFCTLIGTDTAAFLLGKNILDFLKFDEPMLPEEIFPMFWKELPERGSIFILVGAKGVLVPVETNFSLILGNDGDFKACIVIGHDIRQRKQTEQALHESEARYRAIVENNPEMIVRFNDDEKVTFANTAFLNYIGLTYEELISNKITEQTKIKSSLMVRELLKVISPDMDPLESEFSIESQTSEEKWYRWRTIAIRDDSGNFLEYQSMGEEITDQKKAHQAEKESETQLAKLMENIELLSVVLDLNGQIVSCNSYFTEITGWKKEEILHQNWFALFIPADLIAPLQNELLGKAKLEQVPTRYENPILTKSGEKRLISWTNTLMKDSRGNPLAIASLGDDITEKDAMQKVQDAILKISQASNEADNLDYLYHSIHEILKKLAPVENLFIALYDKKKNLISFPYFVDQYDLPPAPKTPGKGLTEYVLQTGKPMSINPEKFSAMLEKDVVESLGAPSLDWIGIPLKVGNEIIGVMGAQTYSPGIRYQKRDEQILTFVSNQIAMAIDRKQREQDLLTSTKRNQLLVEASIDAIFMETLDGAIIDCNDAALQMYGYTREEMLKLNVKALVAPHFYVQVKDYTQWELSQGGKIHDVPNIRKDGTVFPVEVSIQLTTIDDLPVLVAFIRDITEQKEAARVIVENEEKFRTLSETTTAGIFIYRDDRYLYVNPMWCEITGLSEEELLKTKPLDIMNPEVNLESVRHIEKGKNDEIGQARVEHTFTAHNGESHTIALTISQIVFEGAPAVIGTAIDITNRKQREHELEVISEMGEALRINISRDQVLTMAMSKLMSIMNLDGAYLSLYNPQTKLIEVKKTGGQWGELLSAPVQKDEGLSGHIISTGRTYLDTQPETDPYFLYPELAKGFAALAGVPLIAKGETIGSLVIGSRKRLTENDLRLLKAVADITSSAIHRADLFEQTIQQTDELRHAYDSTLEGWALALELRDKETQGHSVRIAKMTLRLAKRLNIPEDQLEDVRRGALLHDIGKLGVPDTILLKNGPLTPEEWVIMQKHPSYAYEMLSQIKFFANAIDIPYCHHEWWDGSGYPRGLEGEQIPLPARIFCIIDVWDALTSNRPYREAWKKEEALAHIINQAGTHFDPDVVNEFIQMIVKEK
jgi:PAS domain S-box-containing protein/putative nucleotidyltransferase with HDIG domain